MSPNAPSPTAPISDAPTDPASSIGGSSHAPSSLAGSPEELDPSAALDALDAARAELLDDKYVLRLTESEAEEHSGLTEDQNMIMNLGPQHPSTHGVLRVVLELEGETIRRSRRTGRSSCPTPPSPSSWAAWRFPPCRRSTASSRSG